VIEPLFVSMIAFRFAISLLFSCLKVKTLAPARDLSQEC